MKWIESKGRKPRAEKVFVRFRSGFEAQTAYPPASYRWTDTGDLWDITHYRIEKT